jgi:hypothetical protein
MMLLLNKERNSVRSLRSAQLSHSFLENNLKERQS